MLNKFKYFIKNKKIKFTALILLCVLSFLLIIRFCPKKNILSHYSFSQAVFDRDNRLLRLTLSNDEQYRLFIPLSKLPRSLKTGTLLYEDKYFYLHPGFNPISLVKGFWISIIKKQRPVGASTITMQLARMLYDLDTTSISGKLKQIAYAVWLEMKYGKNDILEAYLNIAPYGYNIEGAGAASLIYFSKRVDDLTILETFTLAIIPQNPNIRRLSEEGGKDKMKTARKRVFDLWVKDHPEDISKESFFDMPINIKTPSELPFEAPHLADKMLSESSDPIILTTLDLPLQKLMEERISFYIERNRGRGINNAAAILVNYKTMEVLAYIGSGNFFDDSIQGQVNGCKAYRSPGSVLKPFIYALAIDKGIIHPMTLLKDTPKHYGVYAPENSDRDFMGPIFAKHALTQSRNIPAIDLLIKIGPENFIDLLKKAGVKDLKDADYYGSSLAIGGFEISMEKIAVLYAMLANKGELCDLKFNRFSNPLSENVMTPEAAILTLEMLKDNKRPIAEIKAAESFRDFEVYWKTGTSYAFRDAWTAGVFGDYVLVVWTGKFNNEGQQSFMARTSAAPLFFELVKTVSGENKIEHMEMITPDLNISEIDICSVSGDLPSKYCRQTIKTYFIPGKSPIDVCDVHRPVYIDKRTGLRMPFSVPERTNTVVYEFWSSEIMSLFTMAGISRKTPPRYMPDIEITKASYYGKPPQIILPVQNIIYTFRLANINNETIPFKADTDTDAETVFWFLDNKYIGQSKSGTVLTAKAEPGEYTVKAIDDLGRSSTAKLKIEVTAK